MLMGTSSVALGLGQFFFPFCVRCSSGPGEDAAWPESTGTWRLDGAWQGKRFVSYQPLRASGHSGRIRQSPEAGRCSTCPNGLPSRRDASDGERDPCSLDHE